MKKKGPVKKLDNSKIAGIAGVLGLNGETSTLNKGAQDNVAAKLGGMFGGGGMTPNQKVGCVFGVNLFGEETSRVCSCWHYVCI